MNNPYLREYSTRVELGPYSMETHLLRSKLVKRYSWAIPNQEAIDLLVNAGPLIEIGAGMGYWAWMIRQMRGDILAYDIAVPGQSINDQCGEKTWTKVDEGGPTKIGGHPDRVLLLCWPPYSSSFAFDCLKQYRGDKLIYVGEGWGGCTGDDAFHNALEDGWQVTDSVDIPQWMGVHDRLTVWER